MDSNTLRGGWIINLFIQNTHAKKLIDLRLLKLPYLIGILKEQTIPMIFLGTLNASLGLCL